MDDELPYSHKVRMEWLQIATALKIKCNRQLLQIAEAF